MKIFISYGHNDYTQLVDRLFDALLQVGHQPWKDDRYEGSSGIAPGQDFTEVIYKAIDEADFVIAFVTRCTQSKPYCRDERQYAYNKKGTRFIQIRMDNVEITLGNARSYIDMSHVVDSTGKIYEKLFENNLNAIFAAFRDPESFSDGGITPWTKIDTHLKVPGSLKYHDFIATLDDDFVGRDWLLEQCKAWAQNSNIARRLFVIFGEAGTGKTAFIRRLSQNEELVRSVHVCIYDRPSTRTVRDTLKDLAYVLACKCEKYYNFLKKENLEKIKDMTEDAMFEYLFLEPLKTVAEKYLLIIDGLDELEEASGLKPLMRIFRQYADRINPNISFLVTTRPDETITDLLKTVGKGKPLESITLSKDANKEDLTLYIDQKLTELNCADSSLNKKILDACDGNFEYLSLLFKEAADEGLQVSEDMALPRGLNERYIQYLDRRMDIRDLTRLSKQQRQLLALLCASREPIPLSLLADAADMDEYDVLDELEVFGSLIHRSEEKDPKLALFTKGFRDFLLSKDCRRYSADRDTGTALLAQYIMEHLRKEKDFAKQPYLDRNGFVHLLQYAAEEPEEVTEYIIALSDKGMNTALRIADALALDVEETVSNYYAIRDQLGTEEDVLNFLTGKRAYAPIAELARLHEENGRSAASLILRGNILLWEPIAENIFQAESHYQKALAIAQEQSQQYPCPENSYTLFKANNRLSHLFQRYSDPRQAKKAALKALDVARELYRENPCYESRNCLSLACEHLGFLAKNAGTTQDLQEARQWFLQELELVKENYREKPGYFTRAALLVSYSSLGLLAQETGTAEGWEQALHYFLEAKDLSLENLRANPCYESRRTLSAVYENLGDLARDRKTTKARKEAEEWFLKMLELDQQNYLEYPCYSSRSYCAITYSRLGDLAQEEEQPEQAIAWFQKGLHLALHNYQENPWPDSRRTLSIACDRLGYLYETLNDLSRAKGFFSKSLELARQNHKEVPSPENTRGLALAYGSLAQVAQKLGNLPRAKEYYQRTFLMNRTLYESNPCYESRRDFSITLRKFGQVTYLEDPDRFPHLARELFLQAMELDRENYRCNPCQQSRGDLSDICSMLSSLAAEEGTPERLKEAEKWLEESVQLNLENYEEDPTGENREELALAYEKLGYLRASTDREQSILLFLKKLKLDEQALEEDPGYENRLALSVTCGRLGYLSMQEHTPKAREAAEPWFRRKLSLDEENVLEHPCRETRRDLAYTCAQLGNLLMERSDPELWEQTQALYRRSMELHRENYREQPDCETRGELAWAYICMSKPLTRKGTQGDLAEAESWLSQAAALDKENVEEDPCQESRFSLSATSDALGNLALEMGMPDRAKAWYLQAMELDKENYREEPSEDNADALWAAYEKLGELARQINTPESLAEAEKWDSLRAELEEEEE